MRPSQDFQRSVPRSCLPNPPRPLLPSQTYSLQRGPEPLQHKLAVLVLPFWHALAPRYTLQSAVENAQRLRRGYWITDRATRRIRAADSHKNGCANLVPSLASIQYAAGPA
jgi:hypothetical protein